MKAFNINTWAENSNRKFQHKLYHLKRFITTRKFFHDMLQTYVVEEIVGTVVIRHIENPKKILYDYESIIVPQEGTYIMLGVYETKKYYKIKKVVYCSPNGANVYVKDVKNPENKNYLL